VTLQHPHAALSAYMDEELDPAARAAVDGHLMACALCRSHLAQLRATTALLRALPDPIPSRRLVPRLAQPAWIAPLRTLMTLASGAAVFLFVASALVSNITFLTSGGAATTARDASREQAASAPQPAAGGATNTPAPPVRAPVAGSPSAAFGAVASPTPADAATADEARKRLDQATPTSSLTSAPAAVNAPESARVALAAPQSSPFLNPWLWLVLAIVCGAVAIALQRRLRARV
jgi:anti-sigma factor RsiW